MSKFRRVLYCPVDQNEMTFSPGQPPVNNQPQAINPRMSDGYVCKQCGRIFSMNDGGTFHQVSGLAMPMGISIFPSLQQS